MKETILHGESSVSEQLADKRIELKFMLDDTLAEAVKYWARQHLGVDVHCDPRLGDSYEVNTLYLDSPSFDVFHQRNRIGRSKHRIRRYGHEPTVWLETKRKRNFVVHKNRTAISDEELKRMCHQIGSQSEPTNVGSEFCSAPEASCGSVNLTLHPGDSLPWCGDWFANRVVKYRLQPAVLVHYQRFARTAKIGGESLRLTIDSELEARGNSDWSVTSREAGNVQGISSGKILELKFHNTMPALFKQLLHQHPILATRFSKFRTAVSSCCPEAHADLAGNHAAAQSQLKTG